MSSYPPNTPEQIESIVASYKSGLTLQEIGTVQGLTRERIRQILQKAGLTRLDGGVHLRKLSNSAAREADYVQRREKRCQRAYGCDWTTFRSITGSNRFDRIPPIARPYVEHRRTAQRLHIGWRLSLPEYIELVHPYLDKIGRGGLVLARLDKNGPYSRENVTILSYSENAKLTNGFAKARTFVTNRAAHRRAKAAELAAQGLSIKEIAERLKVGRVCVSIYLQQVRMAQAGGA